MGGQRHAPATLTPGQGPGTHCQRNRVQILVNTLLALHKNLLINAIYTEKMLLRCNGS